LKGKVFSKTWKLLVLSICQAFIRFPSP